LEKKTFAVSNHIIMAQHPGWLYKLFVNISNSYLLMLIWWECVIFLSFLIEVF